MADYSEEIQDAIEMIEEFGGSFTFVRENPVTSDPAKPWRKSEDPTPPTFVATAVMLEFKKSQQSQGFTAGSEDSKAVLPGDMVVYLAAGNPDVTFRPEARDYMTTPNGHGKYGVVDNITLAPNGDEILYKLWVRK